MLNYIIAKDVVTIDLQPIFVRFLCHLRRERLLTIIRDEKELWICLRNIIYTIGSVHLFIRWT